MTNKLELDHNLESLLFNWKKQLERDMKFPNYKINLGTVTNTQYIRIMGFLIRENYRVPREYFEFYQKLSIGGK